MPSRVKTPKPSKKDKAICALALAIDHMLVAGFTWPQIESAVKMARKADGDVTYLEK